MYCQAAVPHMRIEAYVPVMHQQRYAHVGDRIAAYIRRCMWLSVVCEDLGA